MSISNITGNPSSRADFDGNSELKRPGAWHKTFFLSELLILVALAVLGLVVHQVHGPLTGDVRLALGWQHAILPVGWLTQAIEFDSTINWPNQALIGVIGGVVLLLLFRRWAAAFVAGVVSGLGDASSFLTNQLVQRPRPTGHGLYIQQQINTYYSFPSGHVVHVVAFFGFLLFATFQTKHRDWWLWIIRIPLIAMVVFIAPSRVLEGEHWPSDVLGGLLLGGFWLIFGIHVYNWIHRETILRHRKPFSSEDETWRLDQVSK